MVGDFFDELILSLTFQLSWCTKVKFFIKPVAGARHSVQVFHTTGPKLVLFIFQFYEWIPSSLELKQREMNLHFLYLR